MVLSAFLMAAAYAVADRFAGGGWPALDDKLPGRGAFWGAVLGAGAGFLFFGLPGALLGLAWLIWRTPAWKLIPPGSATPRGAKEVAATFVRHALVIVPAVVVGVWTDASVVRLAVCMGVFALAATVLAAAYAKAVDADDMKGRDPAPVNNRLELVRGAVFGLCAAIGLGG